MGHPPNPAGRKHPESGAGGSGPTGAHAGRANAAAIRSAGPAQSRHPTAPYPDDPNPSAQAPHTPAVQEPGGSNPTARASRTPIALAPIDSVPGRTLDEVPRATPALRARTAIAREPTPIPRQPVVTTRTDQAARIAADRRGTRTPGSPPSR